MNILLVGCGKMGSALLRRWQELSLARDIVVIDAARNLKSAADVPADFTPDVIVFAVKPQTLPGIAADYRRYADQGALIVSIAAGKTISFFEGHLGASAKIVRTMPNTPAAIGKGVTGACANGNVSAAERETALSLLQPVGDVVWVEDEAQMDAVTALSGSGPAYIFLLIETLARSGEALGLPAEVAAQLARRTVTGSAALAEADNHVPAAVLRDNVTSPNGTTAAALDVLMGGELQALFDRALKAARDRSVELSK